MLVEPPVVKRTITRPDVLTLALAASLAAIFVMLAWPAFGSRMYTRDDLAHSGIPTRFFYARCLERGDPPYWWPDIWCGFYLHAETLVGMCHPWRQVIYRALPLVAAVNTEFLGNYALMLVGMALFLRRWGLGAPAALLGAGLYTFVGFNLIHCVHLSIKCSGAHLPWLLLAADGVMRARGTRAVGISAIGLAALTTSNVLLSHPQSLWICGLVSAGYAALLSPMVDGGARRLAIAAVAHGVGFVGGAVQLLPTYNLMQHSQRASVTTEFLSAGSTHPLNWVVQPMAPYLYRAGVMEYPIVIEAATYELPIGPAADREDWRSWENGVYCGAVLPALLTWLLMRRRGLGRIRPLVIASLGLAAAGIVLSMGNYLPVFEWTRRLPGFGYFRDAGRYQLIAQFGLVTLAAVAFDDLSRAVRDRDVLGRRPLRPLGIVGLLAILLPLGMKAGARAWPDAFLYNAQSTKGYIALGIVLVGGSAALVALAARGRRWAVAGLAMLAAADMAFFVAIVLWDAPREDLDTVMRACSKEICPPEGFDDESASGRDLRLSHAGEEIFDDRPTMRGIKYTEGFGSFRPLRSLDFHATGALRQAGAAWVNHWPLEGAHWERVPDPLPRARLVSRAQVSSDPRRDMPGIDPATTGLVETELDLPGGPPGTARIVSDRPGSIAVATESPARQLLIVSESYFPGWTVRVDGGPPRPALRVYGDFFGCVVEAGAHRAEFTFDPDDLRIGKWISTVVATLMAAGLIILLVAPLPTGPRPGESQSSIGERVVPSRSGRPSAGRTDRAGLWPAGSSRRDLDGTSG
jgi:hypothetical protein